MSLEIEDLLNPPNPMMVSPESTEEQDPYANDEMELLDFQKAQTDIQSLLSSWQFQKEYAFTARRTRYLDVNIEQLQKHRQTMELHPV